MAPVVTVPRPIPTDLARAVIGPDHPAVTRRVVVGRRIVEPPVKEMPVMREAVATVENMSATKTAAAYHCTAAAKSAAMKRRTAASKAAAMKGRAAAAEAAP